MEEALWHCLRKQLDNRELVASQYLLAWTTSNQRGKPGHTICYTFGGSNIVLPWTILLKRWCAEAQSSKSIWDGVYAQLEWCRRPRRSHSRRIEGQRHDPSPSDVIWLTHSKVLIFKVSAGLLLFPICLFWHEYIFALELAIKKFLFLEFCANMCCAARGPLAKLMF